MSLVSLLPFVVVAMMTIVGAGISLTQFRASLQLRRALIWGTLGQLLILPVLAVLVVWLLRPSPVLAGGLLLVAVSPGGVLSNYYCAVAGLNVAFSVTLTAISGFVALATMPLLFAMVVPAALGIEAFGVPVREMTSGLLWFLLLPVAAGMTLRHLFPVTVERCGSVIRAAGLVLLVMFLALVFVDQWHAVATMFGEAVLITVTFTLLALLAGWISGSGLRLSGSDRAVLAIEFGVRNVGIAALLAVTTFRQPEFAAFGGLFILIQVPLLILSMMVCRRILYSPAQETRVG